MDQHVLNGVPRTIKYLLKLIWISASWSMVMVQHERKHLWAEIRKMSRLFSSICSNVKRYLSFHNFLTFNFPVRKNLLSILKCYWLFPLLVEPTTTLISIFQTLVWQLATFSCHLGAIWNRFSHARRLCKEAISRERVIYKYEDFV